MSDQLHDIIHYVKAIHDLEMQEAEVRTKKRQMYKKLEDEVDRLVLYGVERKELV